MRKFLGVFALSGLCLLFGCGGGGSPGGGSSAIHFSVVPAQPNATAGTAFNVTVTAMDASNNVATSYAGTVQITSSDPQAVFSPTSSTLTNGTGTFSVTLKTAGPQTITATDTVTNSISGTSSSISVSAAAAAVFSVSAPANTSSGTSFKFAVTALDAWNNVATSYTGTVHFSSTDSQAVLPANSTLSNGTATFLATLNTFGRQTITATDTVTASISGTSSSISVSLPGQTFTTLDSLDGFLVYPVAPLIQATDGNLYGTTSGEDGGGTVFKVTTSGALTTLYSFGSGPSSRPMVALIQAADGKLYGTTSGEDFCDHYPCPQDSTIFQITTSGTLDTIYTYSSTAFPQGLVQASDGDLYGTDQAVAGEVFRLTTTGTFTTLYSFCSQTNCTDGTDPGAGLVQGTDGNFYGTTSSGGTDGFGTVFKITPSGTLTSLHSFDTTDGAGPSAALIQATDGNFYGTTSSGGANGGGTIFQITPAGTLTTLHSFDTTDGASPSAALIQATDGNFYGTTSSGGANGGGTIFQITPAGTLTTLYNFCSIIEDGLCSDGNNPLAGLVQDTNGTFYGTTEGGGAPSHCSAFYTHAPTACGTVFSLSVGLGPFVETQTTSGAVGASVTILGTDLTDATSVAFNGTTAVFDVVSSSEITTTVPAGATTGPIQVVTPSGTLTSNVNFLVTE